MIRDICYATDDSYVHLAGTSIISLIDNYKGNAGELCFHIICIDLNQKSKCKLEKLSRQLPVQIKLYDFEIQSYVKRKEKKRAYPMATFARLFISEILEDDIKKALYLDCDTLIVDDISPLLSYDIDERCVLGGYWTMNMRRELKA